MAVSEGVWHRRLAHSGMDNVKRLASMVDGMHVAAHDGDDAHGVCATCQLANQRALPHHPSRSLANGPLDLVHGDPLKLSLLVERGILCPCWMTIARCLWLYP